MRTRRLVIVSDYDWPTGGIEEFVQQLVAHASRRYDCRVLSWSTDIKLPADFAGLRVVEHGDVRDVWDELDQADLVVVASSFNVRMLARVTAEYLGVHEVPAITVVQTSAHSRRTSAAATQERWLGELAAASRRVVAVSTDVQAALHRLGRVVANRVAVIENGARLGGGPSRPRGRDVVAFIGRPHPQKGFHLFERLVEELATSDISFAANTVSVPPTRTVDGLELSHGLTDAELLRFFAATDVLVAPYLKGDGLPLAILEAINCGVPVIGFDVPGLGELLRRHGQHVIAPDYHALLDAVRAWRDGRLDVAAPTAGLVRSWAEQAERYLGLFDDVLEQGTSRDDTAGPRPADVATDR